MSQTYRLASGGRIDRSKVLNFTFNGKTYQGYAGDSLAAALLANGVDIVGRSFKYSRPRGIIAAGTEEPNAILQIGSSEATQIPNVRATQQALYAGLVAHRPVTADHTGQQVWGLPAAPRNGLGLVPPANLHQGVSPVLDAITMQAVEPRADSVPLRTMS